MGTVETDARVGDWWKSAYIRPASVLTVIIIFDFCCFVSDVQCLDTNQCTGPLGMETGEIPDTDVSASSSFDITNLGPQNGRQKGKVGNLTKMNNKADTPQQRGRRCRKLTLPRVKWTEDMEKQILDYAKQRLSSGKGFEKPSAPDYYKKFLENSPGFEGVTVDKVVQHMKFLRKSYTGALEWRSKTGQGILDTDPEGGTITVEATLLKKCKYFKEFDDILGDKPQYNPPHLYHSAPPLDLVDIELAELLNDNDGATDQDLPVENMDKNVGSASKSPVKKKSKRSPTKNAAAALESAMKIRAECEEKRLNWEKECQEKKFLEETEIKKTELDLRSQQLEFEKQKWMEDLNQRKLSDERKYELDRLRIDREMELARFKLEKEYELETLKLSKQK